MGLFWLTPSGAFAGCLVAGLAALGARLAGFVTAAPDLCAGDLALEAAGAFSPAPCCGAAKATPAQKMERAQVRTRQRARVLENNLQIPLMHKGKSLWGRNFRLRLIRR